MCEGYVVSTWEVVELNRLNGSLKLRPVWTKCPEDYGPIVAGVFLSLVFVIAFLLNMMVVVTIATSYTLKRYLYCHLLLNLCLTCLLDCFLNLSVAIVYVTTAPWRFGHAVSYVNGFTMNLMNSEMAFVVVLVAGDRMAAAKRNTSFLSMKKFKMWLAVSGTWVLSLLLASPLLLGHVLSMPYRNRYSCSVADPQDQYYLIAHVVLVLAVPTVALLVMAILVWRTFHRERRKQRRVKNSQTLSYFDQILMTPYFRNEFYPTVAAGGIVCGYLLFWLPFTVLTTITPMVTDHWRNDSSQEDTDDPSALFIPSRRVMTQARAMLDQGLHALNTTDDPLGSNMGSANLTVEDNLISEVVRSPVFDTVAVWLRFLFSVLVPTVVFLALQDVRYKCENLIFCCRPNSVDAASPTTSRPLYARSNTSQTGKDTASSSKKNKNNNKDTINFKTPILFSTSDGLHIRTVEDTYQDMVVSKPLGAFPWSATTEQEPKFKYSLCDLVVGFEDLIDFDGQFHIDDNYDYDKDHEMAVLGEENAVVTGAHRAAMGQKPLPRLSAEEEEDVERQESVKVEYRPPTPPRVQVVGNDPAVNLGDDVEDIGRNVKGRKVVRFAAVISQEIPRPSSAQSNLLNSSANSSRSSDSGIIADSEHEASAAPPLFRPLKRPSESKKLPKTKFSRNPPAAPRKPRKPGPSGGAGRGTRRPMVSTKVKGIKSRHLPPQARSPSVPRRFSTHKDKPR